MTEANRRAVPALRVNQWLPGWDKIDFSAAEHRAKPPAYFFMFSLPARELRSLSGISRRQANSAVPRTDDLGIQRQHDPERSEEISRFVEYGYPWSTLSDAKRGSAEFNDLRKPGWLPTAVVLNILVTGDIRNESLVDNADLAEVVEIGGAAALQLPYERWDNDWTPKGLPPFEIIDGQHRLWAFDEASQLENFELPVVAFVGLDISWQAYLFWTINIKPKRINPSLAFDLYPLLRSEDWLDRAEGHAIYRETRAQELTEILWSYPDSPWHDRINMLGERQNRWVTQSAWIKSLTASFIRPWDRRAASAGGLFGGRSKMEGEVLGWSRGQQAAFLIQAWKEFAATVAASDLPWAIDLRSIDRSAAAREPKVQSHDKADPAFYGVYSLINTDQGVRGFLQVINDVFYLRASRLKLNEWRPDARSSDNPFDAVAKALASIGAQSFVPFLEQIVSALAGFDWRTSGTPDIDESARRAKLVFRGSSGYKEIRTQLLEHLASGEGDVAEAAKTLVAL